MEGNEESDTPSVVGDADMETMQFKAAHLSGRSYSSQSRLGE